jgi:hypothetical protein
MGGVLAGAYLVGTPRHQPGDMLDPDEPLTSRLDGEGLDERHMSSLYIENVT